MIYWDYLCGLFTGFMLALGYFGTKYMMKRDELRSLKSLRKHDEVLHWKCSYCMTPDDILITWEWQDGMKEKKVKK